MNGAARLGGRGIPQIWCIQRPNCGEIFIPVEFYFWWNFWVIQEVAKCCQFFAIKIQFLPHNVKTNQIFNFKAFIVSYMAVWVAF